MHTPEVLQGDCNETALLRITHVVGTRFGLPWRKVVQVERDNVEAEVVVLVHAVVVIMVLEVGVQRAFTSGHLVQVIRGDHGEAILHKELVQGIALVPEKVQEVGEAGVVLVKKEL